MQHNELFHALLDSNDAFVEKFKGFLRENGLTTSKFCQISKIPESTIYKIMSNPSKDFRVSTFRQIVQVIIQMEGYEDDGITIGIITTRQALDSVSRKMKINGMEINVREYPANTIEEEIIQGVRAEREGVKGIICGPIAATTMEKIVNIPVISFHFEERLLLDAIKNIAKKI